MELKLQTNEHEEAVDSLEILAEFSASVLENSHRWKWILLALHNALQGFMVLALTNGNYLRTLSPKTERQWLKAHSRNGCYPEVRLDNFKNLYKKIKSDSMIYYIQSRAFKGSEQHNESVEMLNDLRNMYIHFTPAALSIDLLGLPAMSLDCLEVIKFLCYESDNILWYSDVQKERAFNALKQSVDNLKKVETVYKEAAYKDALKDGANSVS